jgi:hypothetical protein
MRLGRGLAAAVLLGAASVAAGAPPTGKLDPRPKPGAVVVTRVEVPVGDDTPVEIDAGTAVVAAGKGLWRTVGGVEFTGKIPASALGRRILRDTKAGDTARLRAGAFVRAGKAAKGKITVETIGRVAARLTVPAADVGAEPVELVIEDVQGLAIVAVVEDAELYADKDLKGASRARLGKGGEVVLIEQVGQAAHVRTYGPYEIDGWTWFAKLGDRGSVPPEETPPAPRVQPTHEVFLSSTMYQDSKGKQPIATLRGGTLVSIVQKPSNGHVRVRTVGPVRVEGWVPEKDLDSLNESVWRDDSP